MYRHNTGHPSSSNSNRYYPSPNINKYNLFCNHCKKTGHTKDKCYRIHEFPQNFKFTKGRNSGSSANVHGTCEKVMSVSHESNVQSSHGQRSHNLTKEQYDNLVKLLENTQVQGATGDTRETIDNIMNGDVNFAGPFNEEPYGDW